MPKVENSRALTGELLNDLVTCFEEGRETDLLAVSTYDEQELFWSWVGDFRAAGDTGLTVFWLEEDHYGIRTGNISLDGHTIAGRISMDRLDGRWLIVGVEEKPRAQ